MSLPNSDFRHLDQAPGFGADWVIAIQDNVTGETLKIQISNFTPAGSNPNDIQWSILTEYNENEIVTYGGFIWQSLNDANTGNFPTEGVWWTKLTKSPSGFVLWVAGVYLDTEVYVLHDLNGLIQLFRLADIVTRPFVSTNFYNEYALSKWELMSERGYTVVHKAGNGWPMGQVLQISDGDWNVFDGNANPLAIVRYIIDADYNLVVLVGQKDKNYSALVPFSYYYAQLDGSYGTPATDFPLFVSISATEIILLGSGVGFIPVIGGGDWDSRGLYDFSVDSFPTTGGSGAGGAIKRGDTWDVSFSSIGMHDPVTGDPVFAGATIRAKVDGSAPFTFSQWVIMY